MELYKDILCHLLQNTSIEVTFTSPDNKTDLFGEVCYRTLKKIKEVVEDATQTDAECFARMEEIIEIFESIGCRIKHRHDFG